MVNLKGYKLSKKAFEFATEQRKQHDGNTIANVQRKGIANGNSGCCKTIQDIETCEDEDSPINANKQTVLERYFHACKTCCGLIGVNKRV